MQRAQGNAWNTLSLSASGLLRRHPCQSSTCGNEERYPGKSPAGDSRVNDRSGEISGVSLGNKLEPATGSATRLQNMARLDTETMCSSNKSPAWRHAFETVGRSIALPVVALFLSFGCAPRPIVVPHLGTPDTVAHAMLKLAQVGPDDVVYDLGSGDGRIVIMAARDFGARAIGVEIDSSLVAKARAQAQEAGVADRVTFIEGDIFLTDIQPASVVVLYLGDEFNLRLRPRLRADLKPGSRVVSHRFRMGDWPPDAEQVIEASGIDFEGSRIYLWRIP